MLKELNLQVINFKELTSELSKEFHKKIEKVEDMSRTVNAKLGFDQIHAVELDQKLRVTETREICEAIL